MDRNQGLSGGTAGGGLSGWGGMGVVRGKEYHYPSGGQSPLFTRLQLGPFFVLKFARSRGFGARFLQPLPKSLVTLKYFSNTKMAVNSR